jgi:Ca-activated chloride channel family protein
VTFAHREVLGAAVVAIAFVVAMYGYDRARRRQLSRRLGELPVIGRAMATASPGRRAAKAVMFGMAIVLACVALARPQVDGDRTIESRGLDAVVALDVSKSMMVDDVGQTRDMAAKRVDASRLGRAREYAVTTIDQLDGDRVAPIVFAGAASHFPLTEDHVVAEQFLSGLGPSDLPAGSNLAEALRVARCLLRPDLYDDLKCSRIARRGHGGDPLHGESLDPPGTKSGSAAVDDEVTIAPRGKAIVVLSDGAEESDDVVREVATARELGIAVFFIGFGSTQGGDVHEVDGFNHRLPALKHTSDGAVVHVARDDNGMTALAEAGGDSSRYLIATERGELDVTPLVGALAALDRGIALKHVADKRDVYQPFLFAAFVLLLVEAAISTRRRREYPEDTT